MITITATDPWVLEARQACLAWLKENGIDPAETFKLDIDPQAMTATVYQYAKNGSDQFFIDPADPSEACRKPLFMVPIKSVPPVEQVP